MTTTKKYQFTQEQKDLIFGSLLGDSNLSGNNEGFRLRVSHKAAHKEYVFAKYNLLKEMVGTPPQYYDLPPSVDTDNWRPASQHLASFGPASQYINPDTRTGKVYNRLWFNTLHTPSLRFYMGMFYKKQSDTTFKKVVPTYEQLCANLTPRAIAWWYMDDGSLKSPGHSNAMRISTESFSYDETNRLCSFLNKKYGILANPQTKNKEKGTYLLYIQSATATKFADLIRPYIIDCMKYKIIS